jgi:streptomycin 6-kinase
MGRAPGVPLDPPERLVRTLRARAGESGLVWLAGLPELARERLRDWELTPVRVLRPGGTLSMVVLVTTADGTPAALKLGLATPETRQEGAALAHWDGNAAVRALRADPGHGVLLLERLRADVSLRSLPEPKAMLESAEVLRRLWVPPPAGHAFETVADRSAARAERLRAWHGLPWAADLRPLIDDALAERDRLTGAGAPASTLLHGDFHHGNVLAGDRAPWLAIDPRPLVGEPAYDVARLALDRLATLAAAPAPTAARRLARLADSLSLPLDRLRGWTLFRSVSAGARRLAAGDRAAGELLLEFAATL